MLFRALRLGRLAWVSALAAGLLLQPAPSGAATPPNIILILTDDQRWDTVGYMPTLNTLAARRFTAAYVTTPMCCPSRSSILSGQYAHNTGVHTNSAPNGGFHAFHDTETLATRLHAAGYRTGLMGKYLNGYENTAYIPPGWDQWLAFSTKPDYYNYTFNNNGVSEPHGSSDADYSTDVIMARAQQFILSPDPRPFFLYVAPYAPHNPATPATRHKNLFNNLAPYRPPSYNEADVSDKPAFEQYPLMTPAVQSQVDEFRKNQLRTLQAVDEGLAGIISALNDVGKLSNTVIIFTSDNALFWGEHRFPLGKGRPYQEDVHVPLLIAYPPLTPSLVNDSHLALNVDLAPTILDLAGVPISSVMDGTSLVPLLNGAPPTNWRTDFLEEAWQDSEESPIPDWSAVRSSQWTYVEYVTGDKELYDEVNDPYELNNVANQSAYAQTQAQLAARLATLRAAGAPPYVRTENNAPGITYQGVWKVKLSKSFSGGSASYASKASDTATFSWTGTDVTLVGAPGPTMGQVTITLDGVPTTIDLYSPVQAFEQPVFLKEALPAGPHTLVIDPSGTKNVQSSATTVVLDAIDSR